jgi:zinc transport system ATP-binding protein
MSFNVLSGDMLVIVGKNGTGKSTLIKCILGLLPVNPNSIYIDDIDITTKKYFDSVGYISQKTDFNYEFPLTAKELIYLAKRNPESTYTISQVAEKLGISDFLNQNINTLSGGQLQKVFIARALINDPNLLIFDEPTVGIDTNSIINFYKIIEELKKEGKTILLVTHEPSFVLKLNPKIIELYEKGEYKLMSADEYAKENGEAHV